MLTNGITDLEYVAFCGAADTLVLYFLPGPNSGSTLK